MKPLFPRLPAVLLAALIAFPSPALATRVRINAPAKAGPAGTPVQPVMVPTMPLGTHVQPVALNTMPLGTAAPSAIAGAPLASVPSALAASAELRIRGVEPAPAADLASPKAAPATARIDSAKAAALQANALSAGVGRAASQGGAGLRETIGAAFDGAGPLAQDVEAVDEPVSAQELFSEPGQAEAFLNLDGAEAARLARLSDDAAVLRGVRATQGESALTPENAAVLRGIDDLARAVALTKTNPAILAAAAKTVESMPLEKLKKFSELSWAFINTDVKGKSSPGARVGNVEHVEQQLLDPLKEDGPELALAYKRNPAQTVEHFTEMLRALQLATDTGKQQVPDDMKAALSRFNPQGPVWYINMFILPHEYASIAFVEDIGRQAGFTPRETLAFQRLIANHNFGPDLTKPGNAPMRSHWWAKNFREQMLPMMKAMGIPVESYFSRDEKGVLQYNHTQDHPYSLLLSAYDRAIAVAGNGYGLATWKKYGSQDFQQKKGRLQGIREKNAKAPEGQLLLPDPVGAKNEDGKAGPVFEFDGPSLIRAMESTAEWAEAHLESLWRKSLYDALPPDSPLRVKYPTPSSFGNYGPFLRQRKAIGRLLSVLRLTKAENPEGETNRAEVLPGDGVAYYLAENKDFPGVYRVKLERTGPGAFDPRSTDYKYEARLEIYLGKGKPGADAEGWGHPPQGPFAPATTIGLSGPTSALGLLPVRSADPVALFTDLIRRDLRY